MPRTPVELRSRTAGLAPVPDETSISGLAVVGSLPAALAGRYLRIGPNAIGAASPIDEWLSGHAMVHSVTLHVSGTASYRNRWVRTAAASALLGTEPVLGPPAGDGDGDNPVAAILGFGGRLLAFGPRSHVYELTADLDTVARRDLTGGTGPVVGRPAVDPRTGRLHLLSSSGGMAHHATLLPGSLAGTSSRRFPQVPVALDDLAFTSDHLILFSPGAIGVTDRAGEMPVRWVEVPGSLLPVSAYDDGGTVVVHSAGRSVDRWTLHLATAAAHREVVDPAQPTLLRINEGVLGARHRYAYGGGARVHRYDLASGEIRTHELGSDQHAGELTFVADPARGHAEDGGWLVGLVHRDAVDETVLIVLDAQAVERPPVATVRIPRRIPDGLGGTWMAAGR